MPSHQLLSALYVRHAHLFPQAPECLFQDVFDNPRATLFPRLCGSAYSDVLASTKVLASTRVRTRVRTRTSEYALECILGVDTKHLMHKKVAGPVYVSSGWEDALIHVLVRIV